MRISAHAKINLGLRVRSVGADGYHPVESLAQSISLADELELVVADEDEIAGWDGGPVPAAEQNLAWRAVEAVRHAAAVRTPMLLRLRKRIPVAAGMGGGSADAAAALVASGRLLAVPMDRLVELAPELGADVPFCLRGGSAVMSGRGERVAPVRPLTGFALCVVVPPIELSTPTVFAEWDRLGEPEGHVFPPGALPPALRDYAPLRNDLYPAARSLMPQLSEWAGELSRLWNRPVAMTGSGPTLFGYFVDSDEAAAAVAAIPAGARAAGPVALEDVGWRALGDEDASDAG